MLHDHVDIVLLTEAKYVTPVSGDWYTDQVINEQGLLIKALENKGLKVKKVSWDDQQFDWSSTRKVLIREIWDYFVRFDEFSAWLEKTKDNTTFINPYEQLRWNVDKHYLADLSDRGINIVPSYFIEPEDKRTLREIHHELGWMETVFKPVVSGGAYNTFRLNPGNFDQFEIIHSKLRLSGSFVLQPFIKSITIKGEVSHMVFGGKYSHSVLKKAKEGDYRVQDDWGGSVHSYEASDEEIAFAEGVAAACDPLPYYARVDVVWDENDELALGEVELLEPELWFREKESSAQQLADVIFERDFQ